MEITLFEVRKIFDTQIYLKSLYICIILMLYYGLMRIGEVTTGVHPVKAKDVYVSNRKKSILIYLFSSKTHGKESRPQEIKLWSDQGGKGENFSPFSEMQKFNQLRGGYLCDKEPYFIFSDRSPVLPCHVRRVLKRALKNLGLNHKLYNTHSFRIGRATDLMKYGFSVDQIKRIGRWKSNAVYKYIKGQK